MKILAIDPGNQQSAWLFYDADTQRVVKFGIEPNDRVLALIQGLADGPVLAVEMIASYGMAVGREVFETCVWIGRFIQAFEGPHRLLCRPDIKLHLCQSRRAKDPNVRQALTDKFGPGKDLAIGKKKTPGPLYGVSSHAWSALALAVTCAESSADLFPAAVEGK